VPQPVVTAPAAVQAVAPEPVAAPAAVTPVADDAEKQQIHALGDLTSFSADELQLIADDQGLSLPALQKRQQVQALLSKARNGGTA
jgi:hypothetical protein